MKQNKPAVGWIGAGVMGAAMCAHLLKAGYALNLNTRTRSKAASLEQAGAHWRDAAAEVASVSDVVFVMVGSPDDVRAVMFGEQGVFHGLRRGAVIVDMGTTPPSLSREIASRAEQLGARAVDAPVSGGDIGAREGRLSIMAGGDAEVVEQLQPLFSCMGKARYMGEAGSGQHTKMCNQITVAGAMIGVCEALIYAARAGLDADRMVEVISKGAAACWTLDNLAPRIINNDFAPGFMVDHFIKDLGIALREAENMQLELPGLQLAHQLYRKVSQAGHGCSGTQALIHALRESAQATE